MRVVRIVMVEAKASADDEKKRKNLKEGKSRKVKWAVTMAVLLVAVAIAVTSKQAQNHKACRCSQVLISFLVHFLLLFLVICIGVIELFAPLCEGFRVWGRCLCLSILFSSSVK